MKWKMSESIICLW